MNGMMARILTGVAVVFLLMVSLQVSIDGSKQTLKQVSSHPFVPPRADLVRVASLGYQTLVADAYWLQAIQYFANTSKGKVPIDLYKMADFITDLDPRFAFAYYFTGLNLMLTSAPAKPVRDILEKGRKNCPDDWNIPFTLGFFYYFSLNRFDQAADNFEAAYRITHFKTFALLAARIRSQGGELETAINLLRVMAQGTADPDAKRTFEQRIAELQAQLILRDLNAAVDKFFSTEGRYPTGPAELVQRGLIPGLPPHPVSGHTFKYQADQHLFDNDPKIFTGVYDRHPKTSE